MSEGRIESSNFVFNRELSSNQRLTIHIKMPLFETRKHSAVVLCPLSEVALYNVLWALTPTLSITRKRIGLFQVLMRLIFLG